MKEITPEEAELLPQAISDVLKKEHDDLYLVKWLRARSHDLKKSEAMFRKSMAWRKEMGADSILEKYQEPDVMAKYYAGGLYGRDKEGRPLWINPLGNLDIKGLMMSVKKSDIIRTIIRRLELLSEECHRLSLQDGRQIDQCSHILDLDGFSSTHLWRPAVQIYIELLNLMEDNYPEMLFRTYIINVPKLFLMAYNFLKKFLAPETADKFIIYDKNWKERLLENIDADQLPVTYGGTRCDENGDQRCALHICYGGKVPQSFYAQKQSVPDNLKMTTVTIGRASKHKYEAKVTSAPSTLRWVFVTDGGSISFGVQYFPLLPNGVYSNEGDMVEPVQKVHSELVPEDGALICDAVGLYVLIFDNSHSTFTKRKLTYSVELSAGDEAAGSSEIDQ